MARRVRRLRPKPGEEEGPRGNKHTGHWIGHGPLARDDRTYWLYPKSRLVRQCGLLVSKDPADGSFNRCEEADKPLCCPTTPRRAEVSVDATDAVASEDGGTGTFTITRTGGDISAALTVYFSLSGTATEGTDYTAVSPHSVTFAAGETTATVTIAPIADEETDVDETVILTLYPHPTAPLSYYVPIATASDTVTITNVAALSEVSFLLMFRFEDSPGLLVNEGTKGTGLNLTENGICES